MHLLSQSEIQAALNDLPGWEHAHKKISKTYRFAHFREAFAFMTRIAFEAELLEHHPDWSNVYNTLHITLSTHDAGGITSKDIQLAQCIEAILSEFVP